MIYNQKSETMIFKQLLPNYIPVNTLLMKHLTKHLFKYERCYSSESSKCASKQITSQFVRNSFIDFFVNNHNHTHVKSSSVVAESDTSLMFVNAGMNQFKPIFVNQVSDSDDRPGLSSLSSLTRAVNSQKCVRVGGKHCDLKYIGTDFRHHTFFEMLGNWSFGDYYKSEACVMAWHLLTDMFKLDANRLVVSYFGGDHHLGLPPDHETQHIWLRIGLPKSRIIPLGINDNFWEMGETGPCGVCTEIYYLTQPLNDMNSEKLLQNCTEIWNIVFIQFNKLENGKLVSLSKNFVDTGMGLERILAVLQNTNSNYDTDLFSHHFDEIQKICKCKPYSHCIDDQTDIAYRILADHSRMFTIAINDGLIPDDRKIGFVLRKVMRRAYWIAFNYFHLSSSQQLFCNLAFITGQTLCDAYPEILENMNSICDIIKQEMNKFERNSAKMTELFNKKLKTMSTNNSNIFSGSDTFELMQYFGAPKDVIETLANRHHLNVDWDLADKLMQEKIMKTSQRSEKKLKLIH